MYGSGRVRVGERIREGVGCTLNVPSRNLLGVAEEKKLSKDGRLLMSNPGPPECEANIQPTTAAG